MPAQEQNRCPVCDSMLVYNMGLVPQTDWQERVRAMLGTGGEPEEQVTLHRLGRFLELGFPLEEAEALAARRDVDWHQVAAMVRGGCDHATCLRIVG